MKRSLCLLIGKGPNYNGSNYLILKGPTENFKELDYFIMIRFLNDKDVREFYKAIINQFLDSKRYLFPANSNDKGDIVIIETGYNQAPKRVRVLYSDAKQKLQRALDCHAFMKSYVDDRKDLFSGYIRDAVWQREGQNYDWEQTKKILQDFKKETIMEDYHGGDYARQILKAYEDWEKNCSTDYHKTNDRENEKYKVPAAQIRKLQMERLRTRD